MRPRADSFTVLRPRSSDDEPTVVRPRPDLLRRTAVRGPLYVPEPPLRQPDPIAPRPPDPADRVFPQVPEPAEQTGSPVAVPVRVEIPTRHRWPKTIVRALVFMLVGSFGIFIGALLAKGPMLRHASTGAAHQYPVAKPVLVPEALPVATMPPACASASASALKPRFDMTKPPLVVAAPSAAPISSIAGPPPSPSTIPSAPGMDPNAVREAEEASRRAKQEVEQILQ